MRVMHGVGAEPSPHPSGCYVERTSDRPPTLAEQIRRLFQSLRKLCACAGVPCCVSDASSAVSDVEATVVSAVEALSESAARSRCEADAEVVAEVVVLACLVSDERPSVAGCDGALDAEVSVRLRNLETVCPSPSSGERVGASMCVARPPGAGVAACSRAVDVASSGRAGPTHWSTGARRAPILLLPSGITLAAFMSGVQYCSAARFQ